MYSLPHYPSQGHQTPGNQGVTHHSSRSATLSPEHHHGYSTEYFSNTSRPPSVTSNPVFGYMNGGHISPGAQDRSRWGVMDQRPNSYGGGTHMNHGNGSRRVSVEEPSPTYHGQQQQQPGYHYQHPSHPQVSQHQRHHSNDDRTVFGRRDPYFDGYVEGTMHRGGGYNLNEDDGRWVGHNTHPQHVYNPNAGNQNNTSGGGNHTLHGVGMADSLIPGNEDDAPIFPYGVRGARAR